MLYLVRHATTVQPMLRPPGDLTPASRAEWLLDHVLSERGERECERLMERLSRVGAPDRVLASPRIRTQETARRALDRDVSLTIDERLHEWHVEEPMPHLLARARWLLGVGEEGTSFVFTHGGYVRAVVAALLVGADEARFEPTFHDLRRTVHVWNTSVTIIGHGANGLELYGLNLHPEIEALAGAGT